MTNHRFWRIGRVSAVAGALMVCLAAVPAFAAESVKPVAHVEAEDFDEAMTTGNVYVRSNGDYIPLDAPQAMSDATGIDLGHFSLTGASGGKFVDFSDPVKNYASNDVYGADYQLTDKYTQEDQDAGRGDKGAPKETVNGDTASYHVTVPKDGFYKLSFKYNNPATRTKGYRNDRDERNMRIVVNAATDASGKVDLQKFYTDSNAWAGWMIFNISGYNKNYDPKTNSSMTPQTDDNYKNVIGNTAWNSNYMNVYLKAGENTITLGTQFPPGQGVYDGCNLDYFDVTYVGDQYVDASQIPYVSADYQFQHPGIYYTMDDLETIKAHKDDVGSVWGKGVAEIRANEFAALNYQPKPVETMNIGPYNSPNVGGTEYTKDGYAAFVHALLWYLDKDDTDPARAVEAQAHAEKAMEILNAWSSTLKNVANGNDLKLRFSIVGPDYLNAAEMIKNVYNKDASVSADKKWSDADQQVFAGFVHKLLDKTSEYYPQANGNWDALIGGFNMAAAVYLDDTSLFNDALTQRYLGTLQGGATASMGSLPNYIYETGEEQETSRDGTHARMGISGLAYQSEIAWNQGIDLFGDYDGRLFKGAAYTGRYLVGENVPSDTFVSDKGRTNSDISSMVFEILANHYENEGAKNPGTAADLSAIERARDQRLRSGGTKNEAKTSAEWYGAMLFTTETEAAKRVDSVEIAPVGEGDAASTGFTKVGDTVTLRVTVKGTTAQTGVRWVLPQGIGFASNGSAQTSVDDVFAQAVENEDGLLTLTLTKAPSADASWTIKAVSMKDSTKFAELTVSFKAPSGNQGGSTDNGSGNQGGNGGQGGSPSEGDQNAAGNKRPAGNGATASKKPAKKGGLPQTGDAASATVLVPAAAGILSLMAGAVAMLKRRRDDAR